MNQQQTTPICGFSAANQDLIDNHNTSAHLYSEQELIKSICRDVRQDYLVDHVRKSELEKKRKSLKTKYCEMAKNLQKDNWMYSSVDDILQGKTK